MTKGSRHKTHFSFDRRSFLALGAGFVGANVSGMSTARAAEMGTTRIVTPPEGKRILLSCKLGMITKELDGRKLSVVERLRMAREAGLERRGKGEGQPL